MNEQDSKPSAGPLVGVRVLELGSIVAASTAARLLGDMGAEVIKIEARDSPDALREWGQTHVKGKGLWWPIQSRNKKLVTLNLRKPGGQEIFRSLCAQSDVLVENFRPGTLENWGLGYDELARVNPGLIVARISGYGQTGPYRRRPGFAAVAEAMGGLRHINGYPDGPPLRLGLSLGDTISGMFAAQGILAALYEREKSGKGQEIDVALTESCLALMESAIAEFDCLGRVRGRTGTSIPGVAPSNVFKTLDGNWFVVAASQRRMFENLCALMGQPELANDDRFSSYEARAKNQNELEMIVGAWVALHTTEELTTLLQEASIAGGPVYTVADMVQDPQFRARGAFVVHQGSEVGDFLAQGVVPIFSRTPGGVRWAGSGEVGSHNREVFGGMLKLSEDKIRELERDEVL